MLRQTKINASGSSEEVSRCRRIRGAVHGPFNVGNGYSSWSIQRDEVAEEPEVVEIAEYQSDDDDDFRAEGVST